MEVKIKKHGFNFDKINTERPIEIKMSNGVEFRFMENNFGELEVMCIHGRMVIEPSCSNVVYLKSK